jgi:hypothetical protein
MLPSSLERVLSHVQKPGRYVNGEWNAVHKDRDAVDATLALCYPDAYEVGMSRLEYQVLYRTVNDSPAYLAERAFTPWADMAGELRSASEPLYTLESGSPVAGFDLVAFLVGRPTTYVNLLESLDLAGIPPLASDRDERHPPILGINASNGNWEPLSGFLDLCIVGEPETALLALLKLVRPANNVSKSEFLARAARIEGVYVPSLYDVVLADDGTVSAVEPVCKQMPMTVARLRREALGPPLTNPVVPNLEVFQDRGVVEVQRDGGKNGARSVDEVVAAIDELVARCGYREVALLHPDGLSLLMEIARAVKAKYPPEELKLQIPAIPIELEDAAGAARAVESAVQGLTIGGSSLRLTWEIGRPGEDLATIERMVDVLGQVQTLGHRATGRRPRLRLDVANFTPRPGTSSERQPMAPPEELRDGLVALRKMVRRIGIQLTMTEPELSLVETALAMGDRRAGSVVYYAWQAGSSFADWSGRFDLAAWTQAFEQAGVDPKLATRGKTPETVLPWSHVGAVAAVQPKSRRGCRTQPCPVCAALGTSAKRRATKGSH